MKETARSVALNALLQVEENQGYSNIVIDKALRGANLEQRDAALASTLFYGVLERRITLDFFIGQCLRSPEKKMDATVKAALRCGAYQILYLDRIPDSAAVNETVQALKNTKKSGLSGFVNGVLRSLVRQKESLSLPEGETAGDLSVRYSVPEKLIALWQKSYGKDVTGRILEASLEKPELFIKVNTLKATGQELKAKLAKRELAIELLEEPEGGGIFRGRGSLIDIPEFMEGLFHIQDLSAQLVCEILHPLPGETICDCCAAPGGKAFTIAEKMNDIGKVYAFDLYKGRVGLIRDGALRLGISSIEASVNDATKPFRDLPLMDRVLCDVPCSGYGVIRRKPEIRYKNPDENKELPDLQLKILKNAAELVKPGGVLVYSTCTLNPGENGEVVNSFLRENPDFKPLPITLPSVKRYIDEPEHMLTIMPFSGASDGFFAAAFQKT